MQMISPLKPRPPGSRKKSLAERMAAPDRAPATHGFINSFDDTKLFYSLEGKGRPIVFCYGLVCSSLHWTYQIDYFRKNYQSVWFDYRGHQNSETPKDLTSLTVETMARDLGVILDEQKIEEPIILGHSMGVNVVLEYYRQRPDRVAGMVLANGTAKRPLETLFHSNATQAGFALLKKAFDKQPELVRKAWRLQKGNAIARTLIALGGFNPNLTPQADIEMYVNQVAEMDPAILIHLIHNYDNYDATSWLHTIRAPTLIISGEHDMMIPLAQQELMHQLIPGSELQMIRHGSHCPQMDLPEVVNSRIDDFLQKIGYTPEISRDHATLE